MAFENILKRQECIRLADDGSALVYTLSYGWLCVEQIAFAMTEDFQREFAAEFSEFSKLRLRS